MSAVEVWYKYPKSNWQVYFARGGAVEAKTELVSTEVDGVNCWRASGTGTDYHLYEFFICAKQVYFTVVRPFVPAPPRWRFSGTGTNNLSYEIFASGENPSYYSHVYLKSEGTVVSPMIDGQLFAGLSWRYWPPGKINQASGGSPDQEALIGVFADGNRVPDANWVYLEKEPHTVKKVDGSTPRPGYRSFGSCNCPTEENCIFKILSDGTEVFSKTAKICPEWVIKERQCPPGTCECRHANKVCCYNDKGKVVKSFFV